MNNTIGIIGCGWFGLPLAESLVKSGHTVHGTTTTEQKIALLAQKGIQGFLVRISEDSVEGDMEGLLTNVATLVINIPPKLRNSPSADYVKKMQLLRHAIKGSKTEKVIFISSISVYGEATGEVTEATIPMPNTESGRQLLVAEQLFQNQFDFETTIVRFGGLIGPDRHPITMLSGKKGLNNGDEFINLIHLNDCIRLVTTCIEASWKDPLINAVYPYHPRKRDYYTAVASLLGLPQPIYGPKAGPQGKKVSSPTLLNVKAFQFNTSILS